MKGTRRPEVLMLTALCVMFVTPLSLFSQQASMAPNASMQTLPPDWVDGSKNPELIPDSAAYRLVFLSLVSKMTLNSGTRRPWPGSTAR